MSSREPVGVAVCGTGRSGIEAIRACVAQPDIELVAAVVYRREKAGLDVGEIAGVGHLGVTTTMDLDAVLADACVDVVVYCGLGAAPEVAAVLGRCARAGKDAITISGLIHPPTALGAEASAELALLAVRAGSRIVGSGSNPGFLLDVMPVLFGSLYAEIECVRASRTSDLREWGAGVLAELGIGADPAIGRAATTLSVAESAAMLVDALRLDVDEIHYSNDVVVSEVERRCAEFTVKPGTACGFIRRAEARRGREPVVVIDWTGIFDIDPDRDGRSEGTCLHLTGPMRTSVEVTFTGDDYPAASARVIHTIRTLRTLPAGLYRPDQLPLSP
jgi:hypothetical protein